MGLPLAPETIEEIRRLAAAGVGRNRIAQLVGCSVGTVTRHAPAGSFDRSATAAAVKAHQLDAAGRRAAISEQLLTVVEQLAERMGAEYVSFGWFGKEGTYRQKKLPLPPAGEMRQFAGSLSSLVATHLRLEQFRLGDDHDDAKDAIIAFGNAIRAETDDPE